MDAIIYQQEKDAALFGEEVDRQREMIMSLRDFRCALKSVVDYPRLPMSELAQEVVETWSREDAEMFVVKIANAVRQKYD